MFFPAPTGICCDNCLRKLSPDHPLLAQSQPEKPVDRPRSPSSDDEDSPSQTPAANGKRPMREAPTFPNRYNNHLKEARTLLQSWRDDTCATVYRRRPWGPDVLLPDDVLTKFATWQRLRTVTDLVEKGGWSPTHAAKHGAEILAMLALLDANAKRIRLAGNKERADAKKALTAERNRADTAAKALVSARRKAVKNLQPPKPRASRKKKPNNPPPLADVSNVPLAPPRHSFPVAAVQPTFPNPYPPFPAAALPDFDIPLPFASVDNFDFDDFDLDFDDNMAGPSDTVIPDPQFDTPIAGPSNHSHALQESVPRTDDSASFEPPPYLLHDDYGRPLQPLPALAFYGSRLPPQYIPEHYSTYNLPTLNPPPRDEPEWTYDFPMR
ncbi:hypothetical protein DFH06DRAFT_1185976 [Mycena polygramma]|nr:hypothetical protein DFH06DRAFT_1185976 [Mycena polygramma]